MSSTSPTVDLNCDLGEGFGRYSLGCDEEVIPLVSSVNVACGMHAGDPLTMAATVRRAADADVAVGAHPGYPDLQGFGRRDMALSPEEVYAFVLYQLGALAAFVHTSGALLHHVKPHGQLYNRAAKDPTCAEAVAQAVWDFDPGLVLVGLAGGALVRRGEELGLQVAHEFFADRAYADDGSLVPRTQPGALVADEDEAVRRTVRAVKEGVVTTRDGRDVEVCAQTVCLHGDGPSALAFARRLRAGLEEAGVAIHPL